MIFAVAVLSSVASATPAFDPTTPAQRFEGRETWTQVEDIRLWNAVERWEDLEAGLFTQESFNAGTAWQDADYSPWVASSFGTSTPHSSQFLVHVGLHEPTATGTPILFVPGAGDNGSRGFITLATRLDRINRPVFALTFAHPHGDVFQQAEIVADAVALIRERTGAELVDVVGHSKGGIAATVYASHHAGADWGSPAYAQHGTTYRGDIRRLLLIATPLGGVDTSYRWPGINLVGLDADTAISPTSWDRYYPSTTALPLVYEDLSDQDMMPDGRDLFPGQRQLLARQAPTLPGESPWLGVYALQPDWYSTYEGGIGFQSRSDGIDAAIVQGGDLISRLRQVGVDPGVEVFMLAGTNPLMPNGDADFADQFASFGDIVDWPDLLDAMTDRGIPVSADADELDGLDRGWLVLGEATGISDGLVFVDSALKLAAVDARGAVVVERKTANLSHLDLLYASPITGDLLVQAADQGGPDERWMRGVGKRYAAEDTLGWIEGVLSDPPGPGDTGDTGDTGLVDGTTDGPPADEDPEEYPRPCGGCDAGGGASGLGWLALLGVLAVRRRT
jgi:pimeloyl-ACP methyl ester carboxylesterase